MEDVHRAGGVPAILNEIAKGGIPVHLDRPTVTGNTLREFDRRMLKSRIRKSSVP